MAKGISGRTEYAQLGAAVRLSQIERERAAILKAFPGLGDTKGGTAQLAIGEPPRRRVSAAARRAMSAGMRRFWARRKANAKDNQQR